VGDVTVDVLIDGAQGGPELGGCLGLVGGQQWAQEPVVQLGAGTLGFQYAPVAGAGLVLQFGQVRQAGSVPEGIV
jgi:hypothetical protein